MLLLTVPRWETSIRMVVRLSQEGGGLKGRSVHVFAVSDY
jgi:hypothetical protein